MKTLDSLEYAYSSLRARKLRSWLTILGIVIAVASIITLISLANGVNEQINSRLSTIGDNIMTITSGGGQATRVGGGFGALGGGMGGATGAAGRGGGGGARPAASGGGNFGNFGGNDQQQPLTFSDATSIAKVTGVAAIDARVTGRAEAFYRTFNSSISIVGVDPTAFKQISTTPLIAGRNLNPSDRYSIVLGSNVYNRTFRGMEMLNRQVNISSTDFKQSYIFRVVGILNSSSNSFAVSDSSVYMPVNVAKTLLDQTDPSQFVIVTKDGYTADAVATTIQNELIVLHHDQPDTPDFTITTASAIEATIASVTGLLALFLGGIASISLIVGGIGVANTMFMSVLERTREIGTLKALGMKSNQILKLFLMEAAAIGMIGGIAGIALSFIASFALSSFGVPTVISLDLVLMGLFFSIIVGVVSGLVPARNASRLQPVEALRYE